MCSLFSRVPFFNFVFNGLNSFDMRIDISKIFVSYISIHRPGHDCLQFTWFNRTMCICTITVQRVIVKSKNIISY
jgi:hypothetical protein